MRVLPSPFRSVVLPPVAKATAPLFFFKSLGEHKYGCLLFKLPELLANQITEYSKGIPDIHLGTGGREVLPHLTVKYGFVDSSPATVRALRGLLQDHFPIKIKLVGVSLFTGNEDGDVLKFDVESSELSKLNGEISKAFACVDTHPVYHPHITVAYLDPVYSSDYVKDCLLVGQEFSLDLLEFSSADGHKELIQLGDGSYWASKQDVDYQIKEQAMSNGVTWQKVMSAYNATTGGTLVPPPAMGKRKVKQSPFAWRSKAFVRKKDKRGFDYCTDNGRRAPCVPKAASSDKQPAATKPAPTKPEAKKPAPKKVKPTADSVKQDIQALKVP